MTEKVILTRKQEKAFKAFMGVADAPNRMEKFLRERGSWRDIYSPLQTLTVEEMAKLIFLKEYEVEPDFKIGDWVHCKNTDTVGKVIRVGNEFVELDDCKVPGWSHIRHATPEEIKAEQERRVWAKIGRKPKQFKIGDAYMNRNGIIYTFDVLERLPAIEKMHEEGKLCGIYPAESFITFGEPDD